MVNNYYLKKERCSMKILTWPIVILLVFITSACTPFHLGTIKVSDSEGNAVPKLPVTITRSENLIVNLPGSKSFGPEAIGYTNEHGFFQFWYLPAEQHNWFLRLFGKKPIPRQKLVLEYDMPDGHKVKTTMSFEPR